MRYDFIVKRAESKRERSMPTTAEEIRKAGTA